MVGHALQGAVIKWRTVAERSTTRHSAGRESVAVIVTFAGRMTVTIVVVFAVVAVAAGHEIQLFSNGRTPQNTARTEAENR